jgi:hypothetical protein
MDARGRISCLLVLAAGAAACSGGPTVRQHRGSVLPDNARAGVPSAPAAAEARSRAAGLPGSPAPVETVEVEVLEPLFPIVDGWERSEVQGEKADTQGAVTQLQLEYHKGAARVDASLVDSGFNQSHLAPFALFVTQGYKKDTPSGYERAVKVENYPAWERWDSAAKNGELNVLVAGRFIVQLDGIDIEDPVVLHEMLQKFDLRKLEQIK